MQNEQEVINDFFTSINDPNHQATYWIIKLRQSRNSGINVLKAAIRNVPRKHAEEVFIDLFEKRYKWWLSYFQQDGNTTVENRESEFESLEVYTNYTPCESCAVKLRDWVDKYKIRLTIHYAFVYTNFFAQISDQARKERCVNALRHLRFGGQIPVRMLKLNQDVVTTLAKEFAYGPVYDSNNTYINAELEKEIDVHPSLLQQAAAPPLPPQPVESSEKQF